MRRFKGWNWLFLSLSLLILVLAAGSASAQSGDDVRPSPPSQPSTYWRYDAPAPLGLVSTVDVNADGMEEFIVTTEDDHIVLLNSAGATLWSYHLPETSVIHEVTALNIDGADDPYLEILIATGSSLILLDRHQTQLWEKQLVLPEVPLSLLTGGSKETQELEQPGGPIALAPFDHGQDGNEEILVLLASGQLQLYDGAGDLMWEYPESPVDAQEPHPQMRVGDVDRDGRDEILFSYYVGYSKLMLLDENHQPAWPRERSLSGRITALSFVEFDPQEPLHVAVATSFRGGRISDRVFLLDSTGREQWYRTPNRLVTALSEARLPQGPALLVGTGVGVVTAYTAEGVRIWRYQPDNARRSVLSLSASPTVPGDGQAAVAFTLGAPDAPGTTSADVVLLDAMGQKVQNFLAAAGSGETRLVDTNRDGLSELLLVSFGTLSLSDPGTGARKNAPTWDEPLSSPQTMIVDDVDGDEQDELIIGSRDGVLHMLQGSTGQLSWRQPLGGGEVAHLALTQDDPNESPLLVAVYNSPPSTEPAEASIELWHPGGRSVWSEPVTVEGRILKLVVGSINRDSEAEIVVSTDRGEVLAFSQRARLLWRTFMYDPVKHMQLAELNPGDRPQLVVATENRRSGATLFYSLDGQGESSLLTFERLHAIDHLAPAQGSERGEQALVVARADGRLRVLDGEGARVWEWQLPEGRAALLRSIDNAFLVASTSGDLYYLDLQQRRPLWILENLGPMTDIFWGDLDGGGSQDLAVSVQREDSLGTILLLTSDGRLWDSLNLGSPVLRLDALRRSTDQQAQLVAVTENGVVQLFEAKPNRPPLLVDPQVTVGPGQYIVRVTVIEEADDQVAVSLALFDETTGTWEPHEQQIISGRDRFVASIPPREAEQVRYRLSFDDGTHQGVIEPPPGPAPQMVSSLRATLLGTGLALVALLTLLLLIRQSVVSGGQTRRFFGRLRQQPAALLTVFDEAFTETAGSPDFLLSLANRARGDGNNALANLADGAFLLSTRPDVALPIINSALDEGEKQPVPWRGVDNWRVVWKMGQALLEAPTITEMSLLRAQLLHLRESQPSSLGEEPALTDFLRVLTSLSDSERVELAEDRIVYLHEATIILDQIERQLLQVPRSLHSELMASIVERWQGLIAAEIEMMRGQANLIVTLKTKRVVPADGQTTITLEISNQGRAAAENIVVSVEADPAYSAYSRPQRIPVISPGRRHEASFAVEPHIGDHLRIAFAIRYDDRVEVGRQLQFADMVHLLPPVREFTPIPNPYTPGTPLRGNSRLFYGREDLFDFIAENAGRPANRNVLTLMGQRRTGKTSVLLRLAQHLPDTVLPVYIDCQSLGVLPGMAALLHDLAWLIADALAVAGLDVDVAEPPSWQEDPVGQFQRVFLPSARALLPDETTLLLVFDEFEAFENLVNDGILPSTFFTFMRHLMQHSDGLGFVFVGTHRLEEMSSDYWSVLFNIALYRQIGFLSKEAALKLIQEPVAPHIIYDDLALDKIWRVTAGHPYFLQLVCYTLVKRANSARTGYITISDVNAALEEMLRLGEVHFAYIWQRSTQTERALLAAVARLMTRDVPFHPADLIQYLEQYGFRLDPAEVTAGLNRLVEREIMREVADEGTTLYELRIGLVGIWAAQNKSLSKLYDTRHAPADGNGDASKVRIAPAP